MKSSIILTSRAIQVRANPVLASNMLELKAIESYHQKHPGMSLNDAAVQWINKNAAAWRVKHPLQQISGR